MGSFCSAFGRDFSASFFQPVQLSDTVSEDIQIPVPDSPQIPDLTIDFMGGDLSVSPGAEDMLLEGTAT